MKKKVLAVVLGMAMVASLVGCGAKATDTTTTTPAADTTAAEDTADAAADDTAASESYTFEIIVKSFQSSYWQAAVQGVNQEAEAKGVTCNCDGPNAESDIADQVNMLNAAIEKAPDGIGLAACDQSACLDSLQAAMDAGIPVVCFDSLCPDAPEGSVVANIATNNYAAGAVAAEHIYPALKDAGKLGNGQVRIGEVNQDATGESIISRGLGFIDSIIEQATADGYTVCVTGNQKYVDDCSGSTGDEASADIIIEVRVPAETKVDQCAVEASTIMSESDTVAMFGSNQVAAEGIVSANETLNCLGTDASSSMIAAGFDAGTTLKTAITDGKMFGAVTQSPLAMGISTVDALIAAASGEAVDDIATDGYWYDTTNMEDADIAPNLYD